MPGPFGALTCGTKNISQEDFKFSEKYLYNQASNFLYNSKKLSVGVLSRKKRKEWTEYSSEDGTLAILYGHCIDPNNHKLLNARELFEFHSSKGDSIWGNLEGAFVVVFIDKSRDELRLINDRFAILPLYWHKSQNQFCFSPRLRYLPYEIYSGKPDPTSVLHFLSIGKYPGAHTPLKGVNLLSPASILRVSLSNLETRHSRYWNLQYKTEEKTPPSVLVQDLADAIEKSVQMFTEPEQGAHGIFLSGGWDSRAILGASLALGRPPYRAITNGKSDQIAGSDTWLAKRMCENLDIPCLFSRRESNAGQELWLEGLWFSEIATENSPGNFGIHRLPEQQFDGLDSILKGDVTWGSGDLTTTEAGVINKNFPFPLEENVLSVLSTNIRPEASSLYKSAIAEELSRCPNDHPADRQQWLWQISGINRYIFGLGYFDEEFIQVRRPLVTRIVLDQWCRVPWRLRINKNLFIETLYRRYPRLFRYGRNHTSHLANYYAVMAPFVRERALEILHSGYDLDGLLDRRECIRRIEAFQPREAVAALPGFKSRLRNRIHDRHAWRWHRSSRYRESPVKRLHTCDNALVFRLYLLLEWFCRGRHYISREC